uniref:alpha-hydroxy-acid oxidizing protein n=1 Tax=uncultured Halovibrio sp. TaxID=985049 RepID=UPI0025E672EC
SGANPIASLPPRMHLLLPFDIVPVESRVPQSAFGVSPTSERAVRYAFEVFGRHDDLSVTAVELSAETISLEDYVGWLGRNFDPSIGWKDLEWIREFWRGSMVIKGILDPEDARDAVRFGADGIVVSNHGGRQLDGALSSARAMPMIADAVGDELTLLADSGIRSGLDVVRMLAQGADGVLLGRAFVYALATAGERGVTHLLDLIESEMRVAMTLTGARAVGEISRESLVAEV